MAWRCPDEKDVGKTIQILIGFRWRPAVLKDIIRGPRDFVRVLHNDKGTPILRVLPLEDARIKE